MDGASGPSGAAAGAAGSQKENHHEMQATTKQSSLSCISSIARCAASLASFGSGELIISLREFYHLELLNKVYVQNYLRNHWVDSQDKFNEVS